MPQPDDPSGPLAIVTAAVDGEHWQRVSDFANSGPQDRDFVATQTHDGTTSIEFGDGVHGALPPEGRVISVTYQTGVGEGGNTVTVNLERNEPTLDQVLWVAIRNRSDAISFEFSKTRPRRRDESD